MEDKPTQRRRARARMISVAMFDDEVVVSLEPRLAGVVLWVALIVSADTMGRTEGDPIVICHTVLSELPEFDEALVESLLSQMETQGMLERYCKGKRQHVQLSNWHKHQRFNHPVSSERPDRNEAANTGHSTRTPGLNKIFTHITDYHADSKHNLYQLGGRLIKEGMLAEQVIDILDRLEKAGPRVRNPYAYIHSAGLVTDALSRGVEKRATTEKAEENGPIHGDVAAMIAGILTGGPSRKTP